MTNLDKVLESRDTTLPTKICMLKVMVCPVIIYGCESWTIKKAEHQRKCKRQELDPWVRKIPYSRKWQVTSVSLPGKIPWTEEFGGLQSIRLMSRS